MESIKGPEVNISFAPTEAFVDHVGKKAADAQTKKFMKPTWETNMVTETTPLAPTPVAPVPTSKDCGCGEIHKEKIIHAAIIVFVLGLTVGACVTFIALK